MHRLRQIDQVVHRQSQAAAAGGNIFIFERLLEISKPIFDRVDRCRIRRPPGTAVRIHIVVMRAAKESGDFGIEWQVILSVVNALGNSFGEFSVDQPKLSVRRLSRSISPEQDFANPVKNPQVRVVALIEHRVQVDQPVFEIRWIESRRLEREDRRSARLRCQRNRSV